ncbi:TipAS antibiotic-recognition domain-containing protein [Undibacterium sp. LX40W]|uniref:TipAS antibiotic-recognition domain-containing protein n=1 Tax=Undibacterium nitidum TaxID=2762298 RepID=A0A923KUF2_9BURK|nr:MULTISPECIES: TipAS antibiotic-recognition domain-containing protein [Undibacterium]MBC3882629.1 TipAS antibiotic-recognition domain-containing protein [Undibacterium nitidum]MBC3892910.1 TipAS antibiotic-recognition domain-containing protein [Undibacterium sp. LX40W]
MLLQESPTEYLDQCRQALTAEQTASLAATNNWSHVDKAQVHIDWDLLYKEIALLIDNSSPSSPQVQTLMTRHYSISSRFYPPSQKAYIGLALFYRENPDMKTFHNAYHPQMVEFLGEAMFHFSKDKL